MRIGIEGRVLTPKIGGIGRYAINLVKGLLSHSADASPNVEFVIFTAPQTDPGVLDGLRAHICTRFRGIKSSLLRSALLLPAGLRLEHIDLFHGLDPSGMPFFFKKGTYVVTLHDVIAWVLPWAFPRKHRLILTAALSCIRRQADRVIVPSQAVAEDAVRYLKIERQRIAVIPWGCEARFQPAADLQGMETLRQRYGLPERYALFVGTLEPRKNVTTLVTAFSLLRAEQPHLDLKLVIAGGRGWGYEEVCTAVQALSLREQVIFTGFVPDEDLPDLYRGALLFVYPSLYEGFGLPILEAMACGIPVIASNTSSMPEVAGDAAMLVEPTKPEALASAMASVLDDAALRGELRRKGLARVQSFSWDTVARQTLDVYAALGRR